MTLSLDMIGPNKPTYKDEEWFHAFGRVFSTIHFKVYKKCMCIKNSRICHMCIEKFFNQRFEQPFNLNLMPEQ